MRGHSVAVALLLACASCKESVAPVEAVVRFKLLAPLCGFTQGTTYGPRLRLSIDSRTVDDRQHMYDGEQTPDYPTTVGSHVLAVEFWAIQQDTTKNHFIPFADTTVTLREGDAFTYPIDFYCS